jgi:hypothetical protein
MEEGGGCAKAQREEPAGGIPEGSAQVGAKAEDMRSQPVLGSILGLLQLIDWGRSHWDGLS